MWPWTLANRLYLSFGWITIMLWMTLKKVKPRLNAIKPFESFWNRPTRQHRWIHSSPFSLTTTVNGLCLKDTGKPGISGSREGPGLR